MNIVVLISGNGSNFQAIIDAVETGTINATITAVVSNRSDAFGLQRAAKHNIPQIILDHTSYPDREQFDLAMQNAIDQCDPDLVVLAGFMRILTDQFVQHYQGRLINIHPSLLPKFKGLNTHQRAIEAGEKQHGCSVHYVSAELDSGAVIGQARVTIEHDDDAASLAARVQTAEHRLYPTCIKLICEGKIKLSPNGVVQGTHILPEQGLDLTEE